jgi:hypothetical protein
MLSSQPQAARWDAVGVGLSGLCAAHCLLMPFILVTLSGSLLLIAGHGCNQHACHNQ